MSEFDLKPSLETISEVFEEHSKDIKNFLKGKKSNYMKKGWENLYMLSHSSPIYLSKPEIERMLWISSYNIAKNTVSAIERMSDKHNIDLTENFEMTQEEIDSINKQIKEKKEIGEINEK